MLQMSKGAATKWDLRKVEGFKKYFLREFNSCLIIAFSALSVNFIGSKGDALTVENLLIAGLSAFIVAILFPALVWLIQEYRYKHRVKH